MATIGQLVINVGMNVADMIGASEKAEKSFKGMVRGMERDSRSMRRDLNDLGSEFVTMGKYATAAAAVALVAVVKHSFDTIDALGKTSDALGISTEKLAQLQYAAALAGVDTEKFNGSMFTMVKNVADASMGVGKAQLAFQELGIDVNDIIAMSPDKQFELMADKIGAIENPAIRAQVAMKIFGDSGAAMLTVMKDGAEGLKSAAHEAEAVGLSISRIDAAKIEQANDAMQGAGKVFEGVGNRISVILAPAIEGLSKDFIKMATDANGFKKELEDGFKSIVNAASTAGNALLGMKFVALEIQLGFETMIAVVLSDLSVLTNTSNRVVAAVSGITIGLGVAIALVPGLQAVGGAMAVAGTAGLAASAALKMVTENADGSGKALSDLADDAIGRMADTKESISTVAKEIGTIDWWTQYTKYKASADAISATAEKHFDKEKALQAAKQAKSLKDFDEQTKKNQEMLDQMDAAALKYIDKSVIDTTSGQEKLRAEYDATVKEFSGGTEIQLKAQATAWTVYNNKLTNMNGKVAAEMRDKSYEALKAMVKNTEDMNGDMVDKRKAAIAEMTLRDNSWGQNFKDKFYEATGAGKSFYDQMGVMGTAFGTATTSMFKNVFEDGFNGNLKTAGDYVDAFVKSINSVLAQIMAETVVKGILAKFADVFNPADTAIAYSKGVADGTSYASGFAAGSGGAAAAAGGGAAAAAAGGGGGAAEVATALAPAAIPVAAGLYLMGHTGGYDPNYDFDNAAGVAGLAISSYKKIKHHESGDRQDLLNTLKSLKQRWIKAADVLGKTQFFDIPTVFNTTAFAKGGIIDKPTYAWMGERGTEAVVPLPDGRSIPVTMKGDNQQGGDVILMLDGQILGRILNGMSKQGRLKIDPIAIQSAYTV